ncbi:MAG: DUF177 domain-containing protein [Desulfovibrio sp.]|jgi:uncharacterized protein|nr:DUF177 domain-containing protein [Desulfovibrio sp.]
MDSDWIGLQSLPTGGATFIFDNPAGWRTPIEEFAISCTVVDPIRAEIFVLPQDDGVLFRGRLKGRVTLPCDRCAGEALVDLDYAFDEFEPYPPEALSPHADKKGRAAKKHGRDVSNTPLKGIASAGKSVNPIETLDAETDQAVIRFALRGQGFEINPAALAWEEFSLSLPAKPLCKNDCRGLCPVCGANLNLEPCSCADDAGDPRLRILRSIKLQKEKAGNTENPVRKKNGRPTK